MHFFFFFLVQINAFVLLLTFVAYLYPRGLCFLAWTRFQLLTHKKHVTIK